MKVLGYLRYCCRYSVFQSAEVQKLWVLGKRQEAKGKGEEKQVYLTSLGNAIITGLGLTWIYLPGFRDFWSFDSFLSVYIGIKLALLLLTLILALHSRFFLIPKLSEENLNFLALHIVAVTTLAVLFVIFGAGIRLGGLTISF